MWKVLMQLFYFFQPKQPWQWVLKLIISIKLNLVFHILVAKATYFFHLDFGCPNLTLDFEIPKLIFFNSDCILLNKLYYLLRRNNPRCLESSLWKINHHAIQTKNNNFPLKINIRAIRKGKNYPWCHAIWFEKDVSTCEINKPAILGCNEMSSLLIVVFKALATSPVPKG